MKTSKGIHSETATAREFATITCVLADSEASRGAGSFIEDKGKPSVLPGLEAGGMGRSTQENY